VSKSLSKEELEELNNNDEECIDIIKRRWNTYFGTIDIWENQKTAETIIELTTGGYSENEELVNELSDTFFWSLYWEESKRGGYYKLHIGGNIE
jgi:hypothetical protein